MQRLRRAARGQLYFELVEKGRGDSVKARLDCVVWADDRPRVETALRDAGVELEEGVVLRCAGRPDFWPGGGRFQFVVADVDPLFSLGALEKRRRETLRALETEGLLELNRRCLLPAVPLDIGLVTSVGSAAHEDFLDTLRNSGLGFRVHLVHAAVQGAAAEAEIDGAFRRLAQVRNGGRLDAIVLIRGGGSRSDLAAFDSRRVARAVARSPVPVVCGVGHQIDQSIADLVAHTSCKTPTEAGEFLVGRIEQAAYLLEEAGRRLTAPSRALLRTRAAGCDALERELARAAGRALLAARRSVDEMERELGRCPVISVARAGARLGSLAERLPGPGRRALAVRAGDCRRLENQMLTAAKRLLAVAKKQRDLHRAGLRRVAFQPVHRAKERVEARLRLCDQLSPERTLARGFSLTRHADGRLVRNIEDVNVGSDLRTRVRGGTIGSSVYAIQEDSRQRDLLDEKDRK